MAHGPQKNLLDFDGNPDHVMLGLELWLGRGTIILHMEGCVTRCNRLYYTPTQTIPGVKLG